MITVLPFKTTVQFDLSRDLRDYITRAFTKEKSNEQSPSCDYANAQRAKVVEAQTSPHVARAVLCEYFAILRIIETNLPAFQACFSWRDSFEKNGKPITDRSLSFEKSAIMWNIISAILHEVRFMVGKSLDCLKTKFQNL
jgi:hypothetical protein